MKKIQKSSLFMKLILLALVSLLAASTPKIITYRTQKDFEKGEPKGVSINSYGEIKLAPQINETFNTDLPFIWAMAADQRGNIYVAGGNGGKVFKINSKNEAAEIFEADEIEIYALATDGENNLFVATSPRGKVYKIPFGSTPKAEDVVFFDPEDIYIWSMVVDKQNNLFVATGEKGLIYKVDSKGGHSLFFESEDAHIRKMILDRSGNILAGTSGKGIAMRISPDGKPFVLYDSPLIEVTDLLQDRSGDIYVAISGDALLKTAIPAVKATSTSGGQENSKFDDDEDEGLDLPVQNISTGSRGRGSSRGSTVYRIDRDGMVRTFWSTPKDRIYAMILNASGNILVGTGDKGRLYSLSQSGEHTLLSQLEDLQITVLAKNSHGTIYLGTSNSGSVYTLNARFSSDGYYLSDVVDAKVTSQWGEISWEAEMTSNSGLVFYTRSGNTEEPDKTWSPWSSSYYSPMGQAVTSPSARFIQFKAKFSTKDGKNSSVLKQVSFSYLQKNVAPQIEEITLHSAGDYYPGSANKNSDDSHLGKNNSSGRNGFQSQSLGRKTYKKGFRSVSWRTQDENRDHLSFDLFYKGENENQWRTLAENFNGYVYSWDSELFPDGRYFIKLVAKDDLSNPPAMTLSSEKISQPFIVDNKGPEVSEIKVRSQGKNTILSFSVFDSQMNILSVEYGLNADDWSLVYPVDGICDSKKEQFEIKVSSLLEGTNTVVIKVKDSLDNIGFGKKNFKQ
ncbi:MAG: hypothetical protein E2O79_11060 [Caldithrix sp.]|nr:MAG: hypothetical protein E2O79_11060 [Caldithrix sp.]